MDKVLAGLGLGSRKAVRMLVRAGRVTVSGEVQTDPGLLILPQEQPLALDGEALHYQAAHYLMLHKPAGLVTAARDPRLPTVMSLLPDFYGAAGVMPVGRLDRDTTGLLVLTDDGALAHHLISPRRHVEKLYRLTTDLPMDQADVQAFAQGIPLSDFTAKPARLTLLPDGRALLALTEGKYHQVKRMAAARGKEVLALERLAFGPLRLDEGLAPGEFRPLEDDEIAALRQAAAGKEAP